MERVLRLIGIVLILALSAPTANAQQAARSYLLLGKSDKLPANLAQAVMERGGTIAYTVPEIGLAVLTSANPDFQAQMEGVADVESVAPDISVNFYLPGFQSAAPPTVNPPMPDDDQFYAFQWGLDAIDAPEAWALGAQGSGVRIAIVDDGLLADDFNGDNILDYHPDLAPNLNVGLSKSFVPGDANPFTPMNFPSHASHVAGVAAAADNGIGIIGVAPQAEIVGVRVLTWVSDPSSPIGYASEGKFAWLAAGIVYAANIDADIINISLGGWLNKDGYCDDDGCVSKKDAGELKKLLDRATRYANKQGAVVIAAAGNDGTDTDLNGKNYFLPAESDKVIAVSATGPVSWIFNPTATDLDTFTSYSNYGKKLVDFAAPGGNPTFLEQNPSCVIDYNGFPIPCGYFDLVIGPTATPFLWTWASGTSAAVPHVSGVAALIIGQNGGQMKPADVEKALKEGADDLGKKGKDAYFGEGRVNAAASLRWLARKSKAKESIEIQAVAEGCGDTGPACVEAGKNLLFLGLISNQ